MIKVRVLGENHFDLLLALIWSTMLLYGDSSTSFTCETIKDFSSRLSSTKIILFRNAFFLFYKFSTFSICLRSASAIIWVAIAAPLYSSSYMIKYDKSLLKTWKWAKSALKGTKKGTQKVRKGTKSYIRFSFFSCINFNSVINLFFLFCIRYNRTS